MEQNIFWDKKLTRQEVGKILSDSQHERFQELAALLLSRTNNLKLVFSEYLTKEIFYQQWKRIKAEMRKNKWTDERINFWGQVHKTLCTRIGKTMALRKKQTAPKTAEFGSIAEVLKSERIRLGMTQSALAKKAGISQQTISHTENGKGDLSLRTLKRISDVLNLELKIGPKGNQSNTFAWTYKSA